MLLQSLRDTVGSTNSQPRSDTVLLGNGSSTSLSFPATNPNVTAKNHAVSFDGLNDFATATDNNAFDAYGNWTLSGWVYLKSDSVPGITTTYEFLDKIVGANGGYGWRLSNSTKKVSLQVANVTGATITATEVVSIKNQTWTHYLFQFNNETKNVTIYKDGYIDGSVIGTGFGTHTGVNGQALFIASTGTSNYANISLDALRFYTRDLTPEERLILNNSGRNMVDGVISKTGLVYSYHFNENSSTTVYDLASGLNMTLTNGPVYIFDNSSEIRTLNRNQDYTLTQVTSFSVINNSFSWNELTVNYNYITNDEVKEYANQSLTGVGDFADFIPLIVIAFVASIIIGLILSGFAFRQNR